jgi:hypothetical protein
MPRASSIKLAENLMPTTLATPAPSSVRTTIRTIILAIGVLIIGTWALVAFSLVASRQAALASAASEGTNLMIAFREEVAAVLRGVEGEMSVISQQVRQEGSDFDLHAWGQEKGLVFRGMAEAIIIDPDGMLRSTTLEPHPRMIDLKEHGYFRVHLDGRFHGLFIGQTTTSQLSGRVSLPVSRRISRRIDADDGAFIGVLSVLISPAGLTTLPKSFDLGPQGIMALSGLDNVILARFSANSPDGTKGIGTSIAGGPRPNLVEKNAQAGSYGKA